MLTGIIGMGSIGRRHARNLLEMGHAVCYFDPNVPHVGDIGEHGLISATDAEILRDTVDAIVICSPTREHCAEILEAPKHVPLFVEKPIGAMWVDLDYLKFDVPQHKLVMMGNNCRYHPCVQEAKRLLPEIGTVLGCEFTVAQYNEKYTDSVILNWGAHEVDLALYLLGGGAKVIDCDLSKNENGIIERAAIFMRHENGAHGDIFMDYTTKPQERYFSINGQKGHIHADLEEFIVEIQIRDGVEKISLPGSFDQTYKDEMAEFIRRIEGQSDGIGATGEDGLHCLELLLQAQDMGLWNLSHIGEPASP